MGSQSVARCGAVIDCGVTGYCRVTNFCEGPSWRDVANLTDGSCRLGRRARLAGVTGLRQ